MDTNIFTKAQKILVQIFGPGAQFREGQYEAIEAVLTKKRTIVVQKTGWGKSLVYFISAKMIGGVTLVISPLLVLMDNQKLFAEKMGLRCAVINSRVKGEERDELLESIRNCQYDIIFTTPETLYSRDMKDLIPELNIRLMVIDECHCISDWGHDFRLEYSRLNRIIAALPENVSVLGTTATANDRVIADLKKQFGENVFISRGSLFREGLHIEILRLETKAERYVWMKNNIRKLPGSGIVYCLTKRDCRNIADFLNANGIKARAYYSDDELEVINEETGKSYNEETEDLFYRNIIKVIVATIKLGMGYDKPDIGFIIHFQRPGSLVAYYQQIGRAGRKTGMDAYCYLMTGKEDRTISEYFIETAFPTESQEREIISALEQNSQGLTLPALQKNCNISRSALIKTINMLQNNNMIYNEEGKYYRSINPYSYARSHYESVKRSKYQELNEVEVYLREKGCLSKYVLLSLNDETAHDCGKCANCLGHSIFPGLNWPSPIEVSAVQEYLNRQIIAIEPRVRWQYKNDLDKNTVIAVPNEVGIALSKYGDAGYGEMTAYDKYHAPEFRDELVRKSIEVLRKKLSGQGITAVTNVPSSRNRKVANLAAKIAKGLGIRYIDALEKRPGQFQQQKDMQNSHFQCKNALESIKLKDGIWVPSNIILVDDMVDSKWTLTVCGRLLTTVGAQKVFPFCLADDSGQ